MFGISRLLRPEQIKVDLRATTAEEVFEELLELVPSGRVDVKKLKKLFLERERQSSTAIGYEVAIPHVRTDLTEGAFYVLVGRSQKGVDFRDESGVLTRIIFLIIGPENATEMYLKLLARISTLMKDGIIRQKLLDANSNFSILEVFEEAEEKLKAKEPARGVSNKELLIIVMYQEEYVEDILSILLSFNVTKATILDGVGIGKAISFGVPLFNSFRDIMQEDQPTNKTILAIVDNDVIALISRQIESICGELDLKEKGMLVTLPIHTMSGFGKTN